MQHQPLCSYYNTSEDKLQTIVPATYVHSRHTVINRSQIATGWVIEISSNRTSKNDILSLNGKVLCRNPLLIDTQHIFQKHFCRLKFKFKKSSQKIIPLLQFICYNDVK